jgi:hypothetical protein
VLWRDPEGAKNMRYRGQRTDEIIAEGHRLNGHIPVYEDFYHGREYLDAVGRGEIKHEDTVLMLSVDGAQICDDKKSDCWIYIWIIFCLSPELRYKKKHVLCGGFIPGPNKPKDVDSFLLPGLYHLSALQKEGLTIWDVGKDQLFQSYPFMALGTADGPGMTYLNGLVGHVGARGCRLYCPIIGRCKAGTCRHYPAPRGTHREMPAHGGVSGPA